MPNADTIASLGSASSRRASLNKRGLFALQRAAPHQPQIGRQRLQQDRRLSLSAARTSNFRFPATSPAPAAADGLQPFRVGLALRQHPLNRIKGRHNQRSLRSVHDRLRCGIYHSHRIPRRKQP